MRGLRDGIYCMIYGAQRQELWGDVWVDLGKMGHGDPIQVLFPPENIREQTTHLQNPT
jgi:hypothetical protein